MVMSLVIQPKCDISTCANVTVLYLIISKRGLLSKRLHENFACPYYLNQTNILYAYCIVLYGIRAVMNLLLIKERIEIKVTKIVKKTNMKESC